MTKRCVICGTEFETNSRNAKSKVYCGTACRRIVENERRLTNTTHDLAYNRKTDYPIPYSPIKAQAAHNRQAEIERQARAAGLSYGKYMAKMHMEKEDA